MANYLGDIAVSQILYTKFTTVAAATGAPTALSSGAVSIYKDDGDTESTSGITLTLDADGRTGMNKLKIDTSSDGTFYAAAHDFQVVITTGTVGGTSAVGYVVAEFSIANRPVNITRILGTAISTPATAGILDVNLKNIANAAVSTSTAQLGVNAVNWGGGAIPAPPVTGVPLIDMKYILGTALTETAGLLAGGFKKFFNVASPTGTLNSIPDAVAGATGGLFIAGSNAATTVNITGNITGNLSGSVGSVTGAVGSVTGAVGSVTGNVGGNVTGSVGSVVGAVGSVTGNVGGNVVGSVASVTADVGITQGAADKVFGASGAAMAELTGVPSATPSPRNALMVLFMTLRNKLTTDATTKTVYNDANAAIGAKTLADDGTTYTESKMA